MSRDLMKKLLESIDQPGARAESDTKAKFLGNPYKRGEYSDDDQLVGEEDEITEDLVSELKQAYEDYVKSIPAAETTYRARLTFKDGRSEVRKLSKGEVDRLKDNPRIASVKVLSAHDKSGARIDELEEGAEYKPSTPFGVRYKVFAGKEERVTTKEAWFATAAAMEKAVAKIENLGNFYEIDSYSYPESVSEANGENRAYYDRIRQKNVMPNIDRDKYQERDGLEGPFQFKSGKILYYDPKEGKYWDPHTDIYLDHDEFELYSSGKLDEYGTVAPTAAGSAPAVNAPKIAIGTTPGADAPDPTAANPSTQAAPTPAKPGDAPNPTANNPSTQSQEIVDKLGKIAKNPSLSGQLKSLLMKAESINKELKMKSKDFMYEAESKYPAAPPSKNPEVKLANGKTKADKHPRMGDGFYGKNSEGKLRFFAGKEGEAKAKEYATGKEATKVDEASDAAMSRAGERDWHAQIAGDSAAAPGEFYVYIMSKGKKKRISEPYPTEEAAKKAQQSMLGDGVCSGVCETVYHDGMFVDIIVEEVTDTFRVIHPDPERADEVGIEIIDVPNQTMFGQKWENVPDELQSEFGFDAPVFGRGESPKRKIKMTFAQYIDLINDYISGQ